MYVTRCACRAATPCTYLQGQVSQDLLPMQVGEQRWTFVLAPNGRVEVLARVASHR